MTTEIPNQVSDRVPGDEAEIRSTLLRLLGLLAKEVARRLLTSNIPERSRSPRDG